MAVTTAGDFETELLINCAGLHCDRVAQMAGLRREVRIVPFRGEYYKIRAERQFLVRNLIYPCLLYTSDAADDLLCVDLGGRRILKKKTKYTSHQNNNGH